jgi:hypothetical protein
MTTMTSMRLNANQEAKEERGEGLIDSGSVCVNCDFFICCEMKLHSKESWTTLCDSN